jgi:predicted ATPase
MAPHLDAEQAALVGRLVGFDFGTAGPSQAQSNSVAGDQAQVFASAARGHLLHYFQQVTRHERVVILLEDIHWADSLTLEWAAQLPASLDRQRLLVVGMMRPALDERFPGWSQQPGLLRLELKPLTTQDSRRLASEILQKVENLPEALVDLVVDSAEGNPFYVEELIKMLIEDGVVWREVEHWAADLGRLKQVRVPATLSGVLQARLDSLPAQEKALLQRASVVGRLFWDAAVAAMQGEGEAADTSHPDGSTGRLLNAVEGRELIFRRGHSAFAGTQEYIFKHAILRDVTYETVLLRLRRVYHAQVAAWLEANAGERIGEYLSLIAGHYELAGEPLRAMDYLGWAADRAFAISAFREAQAFLQRGLRLAETPAEGVDAVCQRELALEFQARLGETLYSLGNYAEARQLLEAMAGEARRLELGTALAVATRVLGQLAIAEGAYAQAQELMQEALALARRAGDHLAEARSLRTLGLAAENLNKLDQAETCYRQSLALFQKVGDQMGAAGALANLGSLAVQRSEPDEAVRLFEQAWAIFTEIGFRWGAAYALIRLGQVLIGSGEDGRAQEHLEKALRICQEIGHRWGIAFASIYLGEALRCQGENAAPSKRCCEQWARRRRSRRCLPS